MQLPWDEHFFEIVIPAWQAYLRAETELSEASKSDDADRLRKARYNVLREGGAAAFYVHHFADVVMRAQPSWLPAEIRTIPKLLDFVGRQCVMLRSDKQVRDVHLLRDVADALKHAILTRYLDERQIEANEAVIVLGSCHGELAFGEGKFGGTEQVLVHAKDQARALSSVLQNVVDAWRQVCGIPLPGMGEP